MMKIARRVRGHGALMKARALLNALAESFPSHPLFPIPVAAPRPIDAKGLASDFFGADESPKPAIETLIPVIPHDKVRLVGNGHRSEIIPRVDGSINHSRIDSLRIAVIIQRLAVDVHHLLSNFDRIIR